MAETIRVMISEEEVDARIEEMGKQISEEYAGKEVHLICILKGSVFFTCELAKRITVPVTMDFMSVSSYGDGTVSSGRVRIAKDLDENLEGKLILQVHDELIVECPEGEADKVKALLSREMEGVAQLAVILRADAAIGRSWAEAKG